MKKEAQKQRSMGLVVWLMVWVLATMACSLGSTKSGEQEAVQVTPPAAEATQLQAVSEPETQTPTGHTLSLPAVSFGAPTQVPVSVALPGIGGSLSIPPGWYTTGLQLDNGAGVLFTKLSPQVLEAFDDPTLAVPGNFAGGALLSSDLPAGADPQAMLAGMQASLSELGGQDFEAMFLGADQIGLLDLGTVESVQLDQAWIEEMGGRPAIVMEGTLNFVGAKPPVLRAQVWLAWTEEAFVTLYLIASEETWSQVSGEFDMIRKSVVSP